MSLFFFGILFLALSAVGKQGEIVISSATEVSPRDVITAYDIVETKDVPKDILDRLKNIVVATDKSQIILRADLVKKLRSIDAYYMFPAEAKLLRSKQFISRMEVERKIKNQLLTNCKNCDFRISINSVPKLMNTDWELDLNIDLNKKSVMIPVYSLSQPETKGWITAEVKKYANVAILNRDIKVGEIVTEEMLGHEYRIVEAHLSPVFNEKSLVGMQAVQFVTAGQNLSYRQFKRESILKKGQIVKAIYGKDAFEISISALAEEAGAVGDVIKFKNVDSQKMFSARIIDRGTVRID